VLIDRFVRVRFCENLLAGVSYEMKSPGPYYRRVSSTITGRRARVNVVLFGFMVVRVTRIPPFSRSFRWTGWFVRYLYAYISAVPVRGTIVVSLTPKSTTPLIPLPATPFGRVRYGLFRTRNGRRDDTLFLTIVPVVAARTLSETCCSSAGDNGIA